MRRQVVAALVLILGAACATLALGQEGKTTPKGSVPVGRFALSQSASLPLLLDTATGKTWTLTEAGNDIAWVPITKLDNAKQVEEWKKQRGAAATQGKKTTSDDAKLLEGLWRISKQDAAFGAGRVMIAGEVYRYSLDAAKTPKWITLYHPRGTLEGIYSLRGQTLRICLAEKGGRPNKFEFGDSVNLLTLKRMPAEDGEER